MFIGPVLIHFCKTVSTYDFFASSLIGIKHKLAGVRAFRTDGEEESVKALSHEFSFGLHLSCFIHMKRNINCELSDHGLSVSSQSSIMKDIFGKHMDCIHEVMAWSIAAAARSFTRSWKHASQGGRL